MGRLLRSLLDQLPVGEDLTLMDVGSMGGAEQEWQKIFFHNRVRSIGFEPDGRAFSKLHSDNKHTYFPVALYSEDGVPLTLYVTQEAGKSSILRPNMALLEVFPYSERFSVVDVVRLSPISVRSIDSIVNANNLQVDFLKLDTQGSELFILKGARSTLRGIIGLKIEVEFLELYEGQPLFADVDQFLRNEGFELIDLRRVFWKRRDYTSFCGKGSLIFGDALYMRKIDSLFDQKHEPMEKSKILKAVIICLFYGIRDRACTILHRGIEVVHGADRVLLQDILRHIRKDDRLPFLICRCLKSLHLGVRLDRLARYCNISDRGFSDADQILGNEV